jgi:hypothetical protein
VTVGGDLAERLTSASLENVSVAFISALDALSVADVDLLERFVTHRGGSLVLLPDRPVSGPVLRLLPRITDSRRAEQAGAVGSLRAREQVSFEDGPGVTVLERFEDRAVVVVKHVGRGRVVASGALDAWRHRDASGGFAAFWQSLAHDAVMAAGDPLRVSTPRSLVGPGDEVPIEVEWQTMTPLPRDLTAQGTFECGGEQGVLRLWPGHRPGSFAGVFRPHAAGTCRLSASVAGVSSDLQMLVVSDVRTADASGDRLDSAIAAHGGQVVNAGQENELAARVRETLLPREERQTTHPMRSPLWILPLLACLGGEWWLRRASTQMK